MTQRLNYTTIAPVGVKALGGVYAYIAQSNLPAQLVNQVYLRVSQINGCAYCIDMHSRDLLDAFSIEALGRYEIVKATAAISLSSRIFRSNAERTDAEWAKIRAALGL
jgi:AhpD family alkylhydroperoxidase